MPNRLESKCNADRDAKLRRGGRKTHSATDSPIAANATPHPGLNIRALTAVAVLIAGVGLSMEANAFDQNDLTALQTAVHNICVQPDQKGEYLKIEGDLNVGATLKIVGVGGSGKITKESWDGISQKADQYKTDPRACAASITPILVNAMTAPKDCSGRAIQRFDREFDVTRDSPEMGGGHNQGEWCATLKAIIASEQKPGTNITVVRSGEHTNNHCAPLNCPQYVYTCTVHVKADPICQ
jgi:hypothetical protein